jgi:hypothetical protein
MLAWLMDKYTDFKTEEDLRAHLRKIGVMEEGKFAFDDDDEEEEDDDDEDYTPTPKRKAPPPPDDAPTTKKQKVES